MRSCRQSVWRLFRDHPEIETRGRYVRLPPRASHFRSPHHFGSIAWSGEDHPRTAPALGELPGRSIWDNGQTAIDPPGPGLLGTALCLAQGERYPLPRIEREIRGGWDSRCPFGRRDLTAIQDDRLDEKQRDVWCFFAYVSVLLYDDPTKARSVLLTYLGQGVTGFVVANSTSDIPGSLIAVHEDYAVVVVSGTTNETQLALQAAYNIGGPTNFGAFGTSPLWWAAAQTIQGRINRAGVDPSKPIFFSGHSYGGAVATILCGEYMLAQPSRDTRLLTYGMPKPGDARLGAAIKGARQSHLVDVGDPTPYVPPNQEQLGALAFTVPADYLRRWSAFIDPPNAFLITETGLIFPKGNDFVDFQLMTIIAADAVLHLPFGSVFPHSITEYRRRICGITTIVSAGGDVEDGSALITESSLIVASGGDVDDGLGALELHTELVAIGGDVDSGVAQIADSTAMASAGGDVDDGLGALELHTELVAIGGDVDSGVAVGSNAGNTALITCTSGTNDASAGTFAWGVPSNITQCGVNTTAATISTAGPDTTQLLTGTNYGFAIPSGSQLKGIIVTIAKGASNGTTGSDAQVKLTLAGSTIGVDHADATAWPTGLTTFTYGASNDEWGTVLTATDVNASTFGVVFQGQKSGAAANKLRANCVKAQVYWAKLF